MEEQYSEKKLLIINADDFGYSKERNRGIIECFQNGGVSSATVLVNGVAAKEACVSAFKCDLPIGLHLNLTEGRPILDSCEVKTLVNDEGFFLGKLELIDALQHKLIDMHEVRREIAAQLSRFVELTGQQHFHVDGHQHVHVYPGICEVFAKELQCYGIKATRLPLELNSEDTNHLEKGRFQFHQQIASFARAAVKIFQDHEVSFAQAFMGLSMMGMDMTLDRLQRHLHSAFLDMADSGQTNCVLDRNRILPCVELMVHPGYPCAQDADAGFGQGPDEFAQSSARQHEMSILNADEMKKFYKDENISCISFAELSR